MRVHRYVLAKELSAWIDVTEYGITNVASAKVATISKLQGHEMSYAIFVMPINAQRSYISSREAFTACTRGKDGCIVIASDVVVPAAASSALWFSSAAATAAAASAAAAAAKVGSVRPCPSAAFARLLGKPDAAHVAANNAGDAHPWDHFAYVVGRRLGIVSDHRLRPPTARAAATRSAAQVAAEVAASAATRTPGAFAASLDEAADADVSGSRTPERAATADAVVVAAQCEDLFGDSCGSAFEGAESELDDIERRSAGTGAALVSAREDADMPHFECDSGVAASDAAAPSAERAPGLDADDPMDDVGAKSLLDHLDPI
jgi:hypothetical protein